MLLSHPVVGFAGWGGLEGLWCFAFQLPATGKAPLQSTCPATVLRFLSLKSPFSPFFWPKLEEEASRHLGGVNGGQINAGSGRAWGRAGWSGWGQLCGKVLGASGVPWDPPRTPQDWAGRSWAGDGTGAARLQEALCKVGPEQPPKVCSMMFSWVPSVSTTSSFGEATPVLGRGETLPPQPLARQGLLLGRVVVLLCSVPCYWGTLGSRAGAAGGPHHCAELLHPSVLSTSPCVPWGHWGRSPSCQISCLMRVCVSAPALRMPHRLRASPRAFHSHMCTQGDVFVCTRGCL